MLLEGVRLMAVGMGTVFGFLGLLVLLMQASAAFFRANAEWFPEPARAPDPIAARSPTAPALEDEGARVAAIVAAIAAHRARRNG